MEIPIIKTVFTTPSKPLNSAHSFMTSFKYKYSEEGSTKRFREKATEKNFSRYCRDVFSELYKNVG